MEEVVQYVRDHIEHIELEVTPLGYGCVDIDYSSRELMSMSTFDADMQFGFILDVLKDQFPEYRIAGGYGEKGYATISIRTR